MGNFEKLVVVAVLFVAAVVLAISLNRDGSEVEASDPLRAAELVLEQQSAGPSDGATAERGQPAGTETAPSLLLNAGDEAAVAEGPEFGVAPAGLQPSGSFEATSSFEPTSSFVPASLSLEPKRDPSRRILTGTVGLRPSFIDEYMVYTVAEGDTWTALAQRFYQDGQYTRSLVLANDNLAVLTPGNEILVPIYDLSALDAAESDAGQGLAGLQSETLAAGSELRDGVAAPGKAGRSLPSEVAPAGPARTSTGAVLEYEVKPGDTLSDISLAVFGTATRWNELLAVNSDKLRTPESLQVGMKLKIPEGGKLPVAGAVAKPAPKTVAKKPEAKPTSPAPAPAPKKKKVL